MLTKQEEKAAKAKGREKYKDYLRSPAHHDLDALRATFKAGAFAMIGGSLSAVFSYYSCQKLGVDFPPIVAGMAGGIASSIPGLKEAEFHRHLSWLASPDYN